MEEEVNFCKNCKRDISANNYVIHSVHCERKIQLCDRCSEPVPRTELEKHEEEYHSEDACSECGISVEKWQAERHKETCIKKLVPCEYCELEVPLDILSEHCAVCGSRTEQCSKCNKHVMLKDLEKHPRHCLRKEPEAVPCEHCGIQIDWNEWMEHSVMCGTRTERCFLCNEHVMVKDRDAHLVICEKDTCAKKLVICEYCDMEVPLDNLSEHSSTCGGRAKQCSIYNKQVMLKDVKEHPRHSSTKELKAVPCEYCGCQIDWNELEDHIAVCGTRTERCFLCNDHVKIKDRDTHFATCSKALNINESISCDYCGGSFTNISIGRHVEFCKSRVEKCDKCNGYIQKKDMEFHRAICKQTKQLRCEFQCNYCRELYPSAYMRDHCNKCVTQYRKCEKCDENIPLKNLKTHPNVCEENRQLRREVSSPCSNCGKFFPSTLLEDHAKICSSRNQKCAKCDKYIPLKNKEMHLKTCKEMSDLRPQFPCKYCGELYLSNFLEDHVKECGTQTQKCKKCDKYIALKNMEIHSNECKESVSKTHGNCLICQQSIPWIEMNVHSAFCAQVNSDFQEYERQNQINEVALRKESGALMDKVSDEKTSQIHDNKRCCFCFENFPCHHFAQHFKICEERPYSCDECLKPMPYREKEKHEHLCLRRRTKTHEYDYMLHDEETDDKKELKKFKKCHFCDKRFPDVLFKHHLNECELREEECRMCLENVPVKDMQDHRLRKCSFVVCSRTPHKNFNNRNNTHAEAIPEPSKNLEKVSYLEEIVEICPSCKSKIPEERYNKHLLLCYNGETHCHFCGIQILKKNEHLHFRECFKILQIVKEENNSRGKKKEGKTSKGSFIPEFLTSWLKPSPKEKGFVKNSTRQTSLESSLQPNRGQNYERVYTTPVYPPTTGLNEVNELPCEFCSQMWPAELLIEHESGCRPDLVSFPKINEGNEDDEKFATAAAIASKISHVPALGDSPKCLKKEDNEWKVQSRKSNQASIRESIDCRKNERIVPQKQINPKEKFFYYPSQDTDEAPKNQPSSFRKKRYSQVRESQETSNLKPDKEIEEKKSDSKKDEFTPFRFNTSKFNEESQNPSNSRKENDSVLISTEVKNYDDIKKSNYNVHRELTAESSPMVDCPKSYFNGEIKAVGAERRILNSRKDVVNKDSEEISVPKWVTFDKNKESDLSKFNETSEDRAFNLNMPAIWNTESSLDSDKSLRSRLLKSFDDNYDNEAKGDTLFKAAENVEHKAFSSSAQETDYDVKNNETFGISFVESVNNNQDEENENDTRSDRSNSDETFYDADDGGVNYFDTVDDNRNGSNYTQEKKSSHCDFDNLNFSSRNQRENVNPSSYEDLSADIRLEEEDVSQKDCDLDGYFQFLHESIKESDEAVQRLVGEVEKFSYFTAGGCKCGIKECCCEQSSLIQKTSPLQACSFKDASCRPRDIETLVTEAKTSNQIKSENSLEFDSKRKVKDENIAKDEALKWRKWRAPKQKVVFSSDSE